jgi:hypothetical protein
MVIEEVGRMASVTTALKSKVLRRVAPVVFVALAGVTLAACGSSGASGGSNTNHNSTTTTPVTTTKPGSSGGAGF